MQAAKSIGVNKRPLGHSPLRRAAAIAMIVFGVIFFVAGVYGYLVNDLRCVNQDLFTRVAAARKAALSAGTSVSGGMGLLSEYLKTACIIMILGIALTLLGVMMLALRRERYIDFLCIVPAMIFFMMFVYYPIIDLVRISFTDMKLGNDNFKQVGFKNYKWLFQGSGWKYFFQSLKITITYTFWELVFTLVIGMLLALLFNHMTRYFNVLRAAVFMPKYIAVSTSAIVFLWILHGNHGILNHLLNMLGFEGVDWLNKEDTALAGILFLTFWRVTGYGMMIYLSAMKGIPQDYYEAAAYHGAAADAHHRLPAGNHVYRQHEGVPVRGRYDGRRPRQGDQRDGAVDLQHGVQGLPHGTLGHGIGCVLYYPAGLHGADDEMVQP